MACGCGVKRIRLACSELSASYVADISHFRSLTAPNLPMDVSCARELETKPHNPQVVEYPDT
jgi:hypothetical protein